jgi:hypothetical protein
MSLLPDGASFEELVQECFLTYRSWGLALSALDSELVRKWSSQGVPFEVVARGIRRGAEKAVWDVAPGDPPFRSLRSCRRQVETEIRRFQTLVAGRGSDEGRDQAEELLAAEGRKRWRAALRKAARHWPTLAASTELLLREPRLGSTAMEESLALRLIRALPFEQRLGLIRDSRSLTPLHRRGSPRARKEARRFVQSAMIRKKLALPGFW